MVEPSLWWIYSLLKSVIFQNDTFHSILTQPLYKVIWKEWTDFMKLYFIKEKCFKIPMKSQAFYW